MTEQTDKSKIAKQLSQEATDYFLSNEEIEEEQKIAIQFGLNIDQTSILGAEIFRFVSGVYSEDQLKNKLKERLGLSDGKIIELLSVIDNRLLAPMKDLVPRLSDSSLDTFEKKDEEEIKKVIETRKIILQPTITSLEDAVSRICLQISTVIKDKKLENRCKEIVSTRVRDVRDKNQTRELLCRSIEKGGLGISEQELEKIIQVIEENIEAFRVRKQKVLESEQQKQQAKKQEQKIDHEQMKQKETKLFDRRYVSLTGKVPTESISSVAPALARATVATSIQNHLEQQASRIDTQKVKQVIEKTIPSPTPNTGPGFARQHQKPLVQDVQFARRLAGPTDELRSIDLERFRRLSQDPTQAVQRIKDMLDLLEEQSYEKRVQGLLSFKDSPLFKLYAGVIQQALVTGNGIDASLGNLKRSEYDALMKLNSEIRL
ncbi:hypothetical protein HYV69_03875 [Candidatus Uhrbacteria bacterium]|nr:hypothetical protein [Candidatus Uhrbacteria bacterium]